MQFCRHIYRIEAYKSSMVIMLEFGCWGTHICRVRTLATSRVMAAVWVTHQFCVLGAPVCCRGVMRQGDRKQACSNEHRPTYSHMTYHTGQYSLFSLVRGLVPRAGSGGTKASNQNAGMLRARQPEVWEGHELNGFFPDQTNFICPQDIKQCPLPE